jgi:hypothetical protein
MLTFRTLGFCLLLGILIVFVAILVEWTPFTDLSPANSDANSPAAPTVEQARPDSQEVAAQDKRKEVNTPLEMSPEVASTSKNDSERISILVLRAEDLVPVPSADVFILDETQINARGVNQHQIVSSPTRRWTLLKSGDHYQTDINGIAYVPKPNSWFVVMAQKEMSWQSEAFAAGITTQVELHISAQTLFKLKVVNQSGQSQANFPIAIVQDNGVIPSDVAQLTTDETGSIFLDDLSQYVQSKFSHRFELGTPVSEDALTGNESLTISEHLLAKGTGTLVVPPTGKSRITVYDSSGNVYKQPGIFRVSKHTDSDDFFQGTRLIALSSNGIAEFDHIGLNTMLECTFVERSTNQYSTVHAPGPTVPGKMVEIAITVEPKISFFLTLLGPNGEALKGRTIHRSSERIALIAISRKSGTIKLDQKGRFSEEVSSNTAGMKLSSDEIQFSDEFSGFGKCSVKVEVPINLGIGVHDLGEFQLIPASGTIQGSVVNSSDEPVANASVALEYLESLDDGSSQWKVHRDMVATTDASGLFLLEGNPPTSSDFRVSAEAAGYSSASTPAQLDQKDVRLILPDAAKVTGSIFLDPELDPKGIEVRVQPQDYNYQLRLRTTETLGLYQFEYRLPSLEPCWIEVHSTIGELILKSEIIQPISGEISQPPELQPLDLRGMLTPITVKALDEDQNPVVFWGSFLIDGEWEALLARERELNLLTLRPIEKSRVDANGYTVVDLENVEKDVEVQLVPLEGVSIQVPTEFLSHPNLELSVAAQLVDEIGASGASSRSYQTVILNQSGLLKLKLPGTGLYDFWLVLRKRDDMIRRESTAKIRYPIKVAAQVVNLEVDPADFAATHEKLNTPKE